MFVSQRSHTICIVLGSLVAESALPDEQADENEEGEMPSLATTKVLEVKDLYMYICPENADQAGADDNGQAVACKTLSVVSTHVSQFS
jgi:hypothetical protein